MVTAGLSIVYFLMHGVNRVFSKEPESLRRLIVNSGKSL